MIRFFLVSSIASMLLSQVTADKNKPTEIVITGNDKMQFDVKTFEVKTGDSIRVVFKNVGKIVDFYFNPKIT